MVFPIPADDTLNKELSVLRFCTIGDFSMGDCTVIVQIPLSSYLGVSVRFLGNLLADHSYMTTLCLVLLLIVHFRYSRSCLRPNRL